MAPRPDAGSLQALLAEIRACRACAADFRAGGLGHEPRPVVMVSGNTRLLICGQAPGRRVHDSGLPFTDPSGDRLRDWMGVDAACFYGDDRIGVAAQAFCYPGTAPRGGDYPPPPRCADLWRERLLAQLPRVELTLLVGGHAQAWAQGHSGRQEGSGNLRQSWPGMTETVRHWRDRLPAVLPLPHPSWRNTAWLKRHPWFEAEVVPYLRGRVRSILER